ncbi:MAG: CAF17-like 4Fe-4S cluster assembly/insertion protein YgfZ [Solirubrobacteraceae bacterium]
MDPPAVDTPQHTISANHDAMTAPALVAAEPTAAPDEEYFIVREHCGLLDRSERGKLALDGPDAVELLNGQVTNELTDLRPGEGRYATLLTHKGKMLGDLRILAVADRDAPPADGSVAVLMLDTERVSLQALFDTLRRACLGYQAELHKRTLECGLFALLGPAAHRVAGAALDSPVTLPTSEHDHVPATIATAPVRLVALADGGLDVLVDLHTLALAERPPLLDRVRVALLACGARAVCEAAAEIVRVERGIPRYGLDMDDSTIPQEAGLNERAVSFTKGCYVGQETVARLHYKGRPNRHLRGLRLSDPAPSGSELHLGDRVVGRLGTSVISPRLGPIALALLRREAQPGMTVTVGSGGGSAEIVSPPFG